MDTLDRHRKISWLLDCGYKQVASSGAYAKKIPGTLEIFYVDRQLKSRVMLDKLGKQVGEKHTFDWKAITETILLLERMS
jgi:hypothetical protein